MASVWGEASAAALLGRLVGEPVTVRHACPACGSADHGRPWVGLADGRRVPVSVARAGALTVVALADAGRVGIDVEPEGAPPPPGFASLPDWVRFEALAKATGEGLRRDPDAPPVPGARFGEVTIAGFVAWWCLLP